MIATEMPVTGPPNARNSQPKRLRRWVFQALVIGGALALLAWLVIAVRGALAAKGIAFSFSYLFSVANFSLSEGTTIALEGAWPRFSSFEASDTNLQALIAGLVNSLKVALAAIAASTVLGTLVGVGRLSSNWLVRNLSFGLVEFVRNTPLLIQLVFWYFAVVLRFPPATAAADLLGVVIASQSGVFLAGLVASDSATTASSLSLASAVVAATAALFLRRRPVRLTAAVAAFVGVATSINLGFPLGLEMPVATRFGARGGTQITPEMAALLIAVTVNSSAYVAEIVRGAIDTLPKGQWEASAALGLSRGQQLRDIILPQVLRIVLPSLGNRYISLTKDTSLGIAIGYPDLFNVYGTVSNQTGRNLEGVIIVMTTYLVLSWTISTAVNLVNHSFTRTGASR
jgi:His/Glu/Gln/Arg/opine family amino acid ABC transporter permease subunit